MKKILLASTALVASAGIASAEVSISGMAEMGIFNSGSANININTTTTVVSSAVVTLTSVTTTETEGDTQFFTDIDVTFKMSGETDGGISFGATVDLDENAAFAPATQGGETIFVSYGGATLTMGDTDGAFDAAMPEVLMAGGSINDDEENAGYNGNSGFDGKGDGQVARFDYAFDAFTLSLSAEQMDDGASDDNIIGVGVKYSGDFNGIAITAGLGYQTGENMTFTAPVTLNNATLSGTTDAEITGVGVTAGFANGFSAGLNYSTTDYDLDGLENTTHMGLGLGYEANALAVGFNYGAYENFAGVEDHDVTGYGLAVAYDLGGGLSAKAGYGSSTVELGDDEVQYDSFSLGLGMSF
ncbi:MAG: porin [Pseudomonadota bacterium]|nr:porin [Pseudomonadota bacterium]